MKKIVLLFACLLALTSVAEAQKGKLVTLKDCYIYAQSGRNSKAKGSALSLSTGMTYSMANVIDQASPKQIDIMLYFGKFGKAKEKSFNLFAPNNPSIGEIIWEKDGGTSPFCKFEGPSKDPYGYMWLKNWTVRNATKLQLVTDVDFDKATFESVNALQVEDNYNVANVKVGDIILFQTAETSSSPSKKGLIKITAIEDDETKAEEAGNGQYQRLILTIKIQK